MTTFTPKRILCPVDFSEQSGMALRAAGALALAFGSEVTVLHARRLEAPVYFTAAQTKTLETQLRRSARSAKEHISEFSQEHLPPGVVCQPLLVESEPVSAILKIQKEIGADLIAMGTHGRGGLARVRLGSVPAAVRTRCAVREMVRRGSAAAEIIQEAEKSHGDVMVIGAQRRNLLGSIFLGSTTELVIRSSPRPVLTVTDKKTPSADLRVEEAAHAHV